MNTNSALPRGFVAAVYDCRIGLPPALIETPLQQSRGSAIVCQGRDAAPPGSDLRGNAALHPAETLLRS